LNSSKFTYQFIIISSLLLTQFFRVDNCFAQLVVQEKVNETLLVRNVLLGEGMEYRNVNYTGHERSMGYFENGLACGLGMDKGIILSSGVASGAKGPNDTETYTSGSGGPGVKVLDELAGIGTIDAAMLDFEFKPQTNHIQFRYVFSSDEYIEWVDRGFNDVFGFFVSGPGISGQQNVALVPGTDSIVSIDNINHKRNSQYYIGNYNQDHYRFDLLQQDGQTVVLTADIKTVPCEWYKIQMAIADVGDPDKDSWVFLEAKSFQDETGLGNDSALCTNEFTMTLNAGHDDKKVKWHNGDTSHSIQVSGYGNYWVEILSDCGVFRDEINFFPALGSIDIGKDSFLCGNESGPILEVQDRKFDSYLWSDGSTTRQLKVPGPGDYWLQVEKFGCLKSDSIYFAGKDLPVFSFGKDSLFCGDVNTVLVGPESAEYLWWDGSNNQSKKITDPGIYWLLSTKEGCSYSDTVSFALREEFDFDLGPPVIEYCAMEPTDLVTGLTGKNGYEFLWSTGETVSAIHVRQSGIYSVEVQDVICPFVKTDQVDIRSLSEGGSYWVPNAFTPNQDNLNEGFLPIREFEEVLAYEFMVFTRWGEIIFHTFDKDLAWDGTIDGVEAPSETYFWYTRIQATCLNDDQFYQKGTVQLLR